MFTRFLKIQCSLPLQRTCECVRSDGSATEGRRAHQQVVGDSRHCDIHALRAQFCQRRRVRHETKHIYPLSRQRAHVVAKGFSGRQFQDYHDSDYQSGGMQLQRHSQYT